MNFKPIDEMSLRQLFSTEYAKDILGLTYIGPVLDQLGKVDPSPDALILDIRKSPYRVKRCEFKFSPRGKEDFSHNGKFDIAVVWSIQSPITKDKLLSDLLEQNGCHEIVVLNEISKLHNLPEYDLKNIQRSFDVESVKHLILRARNGLPSLIVIYIASQIFPYRFNSEKMIEMLMRKYPSVAAMQSKGRGNVVGTFIQTSPPLLKKMMWQVYQWNEDFDPLIGNAMIAELISLNFQSELPTESEIKEVIWTGS